MRCGLAQVGIVLQLTLFWTCAVRPRLLPCVSSAAALAEAVPLPYISSGSFLVETPPFASRPGAGPAAVHHLGVRRLGAVGHARDQRRDRGRDRDAAGNAPLQSM